MLCVFILSCICATQWVCIHYSGQNIFWVYDTLFTCLSIFGWIFRWIIHILEQLIIYVKIEGVNFDFSYYFVIRLLSVSLCFEGFVHIGLCKVICRTLAFVVSVLFLSDIVSLAWIFISYKSEIYLVYMNSFYLTFIQVKIGPLLYVYRYIAHLL
jgi:hypothetical protein